MNNANIQTGIQYFKAENKTGALQIFLQVLEREPDNEIAWLWLAACVDKPEQKRDCFHKVLAINPNNINAQKALAELELQAIPEAKPIPQHGTVLKCPSCGGVMGKPDHTGLIQCGYCGTTITYHPPVEKIEKKNVERFLIICKAAIDGGNHDEAMQYANKILEIDPENFIAWVYKAISTFWLTTAVNNRYNEAIGYLKKAELIDKSNPLISETQDSLTKRQSELFIYLGADDIHNGNVIANIYEHSYESREHSQEHYVKAMDNLLLALHYDPTSYHILTLINDLASKVHWIKWSTEVKGKIALLKLLEQKNIAINSLPDLHKQLKENQGKLEKLKKENGFFSGMKTDSMTNKIKSLKQQIAQYERIANSEVKH